VEGGGHNQATPGWYTDPSGSGQRYWDGSTWTEHFQPPPPPTPQQQSQQQAAYAAQQRAAHQAAEVQARRQRAERAPAAMQWWYRMSVGARITLAIVSGLIVLAAIGSALPAAEQTANRTAPPPEETPTEESPATPPADDKPDCPPNQATIDCTPRVGPNGRVRVDALVWQVTDVETAQTIGDQEFGLGAKADGVFLIVHIRVRSTHDESRTLSDNAIQLQAGRQASIPTTTARRRPSETVRPSVP